MKTMNDIENKLIELWDMMRTVPAECKGSDKRASENRHRFMEIRRAIHDLIEEQ